MRGGPQQRPPALQYVEEYVEGYVKETLSPSGWTPRYRYPTSFRYGIRPPGHHPGAYTREGVREG